MKDYKEYLRHRLIEYRDMLDDAGYEYLRDEIQHDIDEMELELAIADFATRRK